MTTLLKGERYKGKWRTTRYLRAPLAGWYLKRAHHYAVSSQKEESRDSSSEHEHAFEQAFLAIVYSALALEAFANQIAEDIVPEEKLEAFIWTRKPFARHKRLSAPASKWVHLLGLVGRKTAHNERHIRNADQVVRARNAFVHYEPRESSAKIITDVEPLLESEKVGEEMKIDINVYMPFTAVQGSKLVPSLVEKEIDPARAKDHYSAVREMLLFWHQVQNSDTDSLEQAFPAI